MKRYSTILILSAFLCPALLTAQKVAKTADGEIFLIFPDGKWKDVTKDSAEHAAHAAHAKIIPPKLPSTEETLIEHEHYTIGYSEKYRLPLWTWHKLTEEQIKKCVLKRKGDFVADPATDKIQAGKKDYAGTTWQKGHMVPCEDMSFDEKAMKESFYYSNCVPQTAKLNAGQWARLEKLVRNWARDNGEVEVFSGPVIEPKLKTFGETKVTIPKRCFKIVLDYKKPQVKAIAFIMPNQDASLEKPEVYACSIDEVEKITGMDFFSELPDELEKEVESKFDATQWDWDVNKYKEE